MAEREPKRDLSYLAGWLCATPFLGLVGVVDLFFRGANRRAFQALLCGLAVLGAYFLFLSFIGSESDATGRLILGAWIILPPVMLAYLRTLEWPAPATRERGRWVSVIIVFVIVGILAEIAISAYEQKGILGKVYGASADVKQRVEDYVRTNQKLPVTGDDVTGDKPLVSKFIEFLSVGADGAITIRFSKSVGSAAGKTIVWTPHLNSGAVAWSCNGGTLPERYRSPECRHGFAR